MTEFNNCEHIRYSCHFSLHATKLLDRTLHENHFTELKGKSRLHITQAEQPVHTFVISGDFVIRKTLGVFSSDFYFQNKAFDENH